MRHRGSLSHHARGIFPASTSGRSVSHPSCSRSSASSKSAAKKMKRKGDVVGGVLATKHGPPSSRHGIAQDRASHPTTRHAKHIPADPAHPAWRSTTQTGQTYTRLLPRSLTMHLCQPTRIVRRLAKGVEDVERCFSPFPCCIADRRLAEWGLDTHKRRGHVMCVCMSQGVVPDQKKTPIRFEKPTRPHTHHAPSSPSNARSAP